MTRYAIGCCIVLFSFMGFIKSLHATTYTVDIYASVPGCGDALIQSGEECDGANIGGATCESVGFDEGVLSCSSVCTFITSSCALVEDSSGGSRVTSSGSALQVTDTNVIVTGSAAPAMSVSLLKDGQQIATVPTKADGSFQITVTGLSSGLYRMQVVGTYGFSEVTKSEPFEVRIVKDSTTKISGVTLPPLLRTTMDGQTVVVLGNTLPNTEVTLVVDGMPIDTVFSDDQGGYSFTLEDASLQGKTASVMIKNAGVQFDSAAVVIPGVNTVVEDNSICHFGIDTNGDCRVDVVDFFVMRWRYLRSLVVEKFDFNRDGEVDIVDFSILAFHWTG